MARSGRYEPPPGFPARRLAPAAFALLGAAAVVSTAWELWAHPIYTDRTAVQQLGQLSSAGVGAVAAVVLLRRRRTNPTWLLLAWFLTCGFLQDLGPPNGWLLAVGFATADLVTPAFMHLVLAYPAGRLPGRPERAVVAAAYAVALLRGMGDALFAPYVRTRPPGRFASALFVDGVDWLWPDWLTDLLDQLLQVVALIGFALLLGAMWRARHRAAVRAPLAIAAGASAVVFTVSAFTEFAPESADVAFFWAILALQAAVPVALGLGLLVQHRTRAVVADLVLALDGAPPDQLERTLATVLRDPDLELRLFDAGGLLLDPAGTGHAVDAAQPLGSGERRKADVLRVTRITTPVRNRDGRLIAEILSTPRPEEHPDLLPAVATAARFAIEAAAMTAQLRRQVDELHASRQRVVDAAAAERRRIERNLHDGAQQQLLALGMQLDQVRRRVRRQADPGAGAAVPASPVAGAAVPGAASMDDSLLRELDGAVDALRSTIGELQVLARGVHPPILTSRGLVPAVRSLVERIPAPVGLTCVGERRLDPAVEAAGYYVISESLGNALRHARAERVHVDIRIDAAVHVTVTDDGCGGADPDRDGLRGLADRVAAVGGTLRISSPPGQGTTVEAHLPCAS
ncbi:MAG: sensor histidine kinase [Vicinamibacterales bacterium]